MAEIELLGFKVMKQVLLKQLAAATAIKVQLRNYQLTNGGKEYFFKVYQNLEGVIFLSKI